MSSLKSVPEIFVSYAWDNDSEEVIKKLKLVCDKHGVKLTRDKTEIGFKGIISDFMKKLGKSNCIVLILTDKYLKSTNCMFELLEIISYGNVHDRIFPIVLKSARFYNPKETVKYVKYWEQEAKELDSELKSLGSIANTQGMRDHLDQYERYRAKIGELTVLLRDMNNLTVEEHMDSDFHELMEQVLRKFSSDELANQDVKENGNSVDDEKLTNNNSILLKNNYDKELAQITSDKLLESIRNRGYWKFNLRPLQQQASLSTEIIESLVHRCSTGNGWPFPRVPNPSLEGEGYSNGMNYLQGISDYGARKEYWRMYKSGQFIDFKALREDWYESDPRLINLSQEVLPGTVVNINGSIIYYLTDAIHFCSKLCLHQGFKGEMEISLVLNNVLDRKLKVDLPEREPFHNLYNTGEQSIELSETIESEHLIINHLDVSHHMILKTLSAFGFHPPASSVKNDQIKYLKSQ